MALLVNLLRVQGIEVGRATARDQAEGRHVSRPARSSSSAISRTAGSRRSCSRSRTSPTPNLRTYDDTGWTMGLMLQTEVKAIADKAVLDVAVEPVDRVEAAGQRSTGSRRRGYVVAQPRLEQPGHAALPAEGSEGAGGRERRSRSATTEYPGGLVHHPRRSRARRARRRVTTAIEPLGPDGGRRSPRCPTSPKHDVDLPRLAMYTTWGNTQEVGWVRHAFDTFEVPFDLIYKERVKRATCARPTT